MSGPIGSSQWIYNPSTGFYDHTINQSLRFNSGDSSYLAFTPASATAGTWTVSFWVKRGVLSTTQYIYYSGAVSARGGFYFLSDDRFGVSPFNSSGANANLFSVPVFRDPAQWYHIVMTANGITTSNLSSNLNIYVNGVEISHTKTQLSSPTGGDRINDAQAKRISGLTPSGGQHFDGYLAEWHWIDGAVYDQNNFGEFRDGIWTAKEVTGLSYGAAGYYLNFADSSDIGNNANTTDGTNDWSPTNLVASDVVPDSPTGNNFGVMNPLDKNSMTLSEGNLKVVPSGDYKAIRGTFGIPTSGKWYFEARYLTPGGGNVQDNQVGIVTASNVLSGSSPYPQAFTYGVGYLGLGQINRGGSAAQSSLTAVTAGKVLGVAVNVDDDEVQFYLDGSAVGTTHALVSTTEPNFPFYVGATNRGVIFNFGQDSTFTGAVSAGGNADANGIGDFAYAPPSDHLALCTSNLPDPTIGPGQSSQADDNFNTVLWTGNGSTQSITGVGFQPDFIWAKERSSTSGHTLLDVVRGVNKGLESNSTGDEENYSTTTQTSFDTDGFSIGSNGRINQSSQTYVAWNWKAGGSASSNSNGSITSSVSANQDAGFSIVSWTGTGSAGTIGHGLSSAPEHIIVKNRDSTAGRIWLNYVKAAVSDAETDYLSLNGTGAAVDNADVWNDTAPTSTVFSVGSNASANEGSDKMIAYCFHSVEGYSKFGSYTGNGSADGPFVHTGFRPAWVMVKGAGNTYSWYIHDSKRDTFNHTDAELAANSSSAEYSAEGAGGGERSDFLSNGFKVRTSNVGWNQSGITYIYLAFAEAPFKFANAR